MKKPSSGSKPRRKGVSKTNKTSNEVAFFETFAYPSNQLSVFLFVPAICEFVISLRDSDTMVRYRPIDRIGFILWLWEHDVRDITCQVERMLKGTQAAEDY